MRAAPTSVRKAASLHRWAGRIAVQHLGQTLLGYYLREASRKFAEDLTTRGGAQLCHVIEFGRKGAHAGRRRPNFDDQIANLSLWDHCLHRVPVSPADARVKAE